MYTVILPSLVVEGRNVLCIKKDQMVSRVVRTDIGISSFT